MIAKQKKELREISNKIAERIQIGSDRFSQKSLENEEIRSRSAQKVRDSHNRIDQRV